MGPLPQWFRNTLEGRLESAMRRLACLLIACSATLPGNAAARTVEDEQLWVNLTAMGPVSGDLIYFAEIQPRFGNQASGVDQTLLRGGLGWKISEKVSVYQGYAHVTLADANEDRSFQQLNWAIGKPLGGELSSRTRLEQRWRSDGQDMGWRLREMLRFEKPLKSDSRAPNGVAWVEGFVALNSTDWGADAGFDQLRSFAGLGFKLMGKSTMEVGYINQLINQSGGQRRMNHVASITFTFRR